MYPIFLKTPWFTIYSYGLLIAIGYTVAMLWTMKEAKKEGLDSETFFDMFILQLIVGIMGSRLLYLVEYAPDTLSLKTFFAFEQGGLTFYGAVITGLAFNIIFLKIKSRNFNAFNWNNGSCKAKCVFGSVPISLFSKE